jgi:PucR-like helix-turn-helix protein/diguanylate cyclase with GGDEF domain
MSRDANGRARSVEDVRANLVGRLRVRQPEIEAAIFAHVREMYGSIGSEDAEYQAGLSAAVTAVVDYALTGIAQDEEWSGPIPSAAITQARRAARNGVNLDTLVLRYIAGHRLLGEFVMDEADRSGYSSYSHALRQLSRTQELLLERLTAAVASEHRQEVDRIGRSAEQRRRELVQQLLDGKPTDTAELEYDFEAWHLGVIATGIAAEKAVRGLADGLGRHLLLVACGEGTVWAWLGGRRQLAITDIERVLAANGVAGVSLAIGEPRRRIDGWRQTHREAQAALSVALRMPPRLTRCADVPLEAALLQNPVLARLLIETHLSPLDGLRIGGQVARQTLRAYIACNHNISSAAHKLKVTRHTVENRLHQIEQLFDRPLRACLVRLELALRLEELGYPPAPTLHRLPGEMAHQTHVETALRG